MSAEVRQALANAANTVEGVRAHPYYWQSASPGSAMVRLSRINYPDTLGGVATWAVWVMVPQDIATAEKYLDSKIPGLVEALGEEMRVTTVTPSTFAFDTGHVPGVSIEGSREYDE